MTKINFFKSCLNLSNTETMIIDTVRKFCRKELKSRINQDIKNPNPYEIYRKFGDLGLLGPTIKEYGCLGTNYKTYGLIAKEIEYIDSGYRSMFSVQSSLVMNPINKYGTPEVKDKYIQKLSTGELIGCFGLTEADSGSDASSMKTEAKLIDNDYVINGSKTWITNSPIADILLVWAKLDGKVNGFILEKNMKGIETPEIKSKMSLLSSPTGMIFLDNVKVPQENKLNIIGMKGPLSCLNDARLGISFGVLGAAEFCIDTALEYSLNRQLFGSLLAEKQIFQMKLANMITEYNLGLLTAVEVAKNVDNNSFVPEMISLAKRNNCLKSLEITRQARDILGGNGISLDYDIFRHLINLETVNTYEGTHDIHSLILGNYFTNLKAF